MTEKFTLILILLVCFLSLHSQKNSDASKFIPSINSDSLKKALSILASDKMEGRKTGSNGEKIAAEFLKKEFTKYGLKPLSQSGYENSFDVYRDSILSTSLSVNEVDYKLEVDFGVFTDFNHSCNSQFSEVIFAGYGIKEKKYNNYRNLDVSGKLVMVMDGEPKNNSTYLISGTKSESKWNYPPSKVNTATSLGAAALLIVVKEFPMKSYSNQVSSLWKSKYKFYQGVNTFFISEKVARNIIGKNYDSLLINLAKGVDSIGLDPLNTEISLTYNKITQKLKATNLLGMIEGTEKKDECVFITAHYDHLGVINGEIYPGADDNCSGTSAVLSLASAFSEAARKGSRPKRSIVFMLTSGEEYGLWGSEHYTNKPYFSLDKTSACLNIDMLGRVDMNIHDDKDSLNHINIIGDDKLSSELRIINESCNSTIGLHLDYKHNDKNDRMRYFYRSDHFNFAKHGVPCIFYSDGTNKDYHKPSDTFEKINFELLRKRACLVFITAWQIANKKTLLKRDLGPLK